MGIDSLFESQMTARGSAVFGSFWWLISQHQTFPTSLWLKIFWKASKITDYAIKLFAHTYSWSLKLTRIMKDSWVTQTQLHRRWDKQIPTWPPADNSVCGERLGQGYSAGSASLWGWIFWTKSPFNIRDQHAQHLLGCRPVLHTDHSRPRPPVNTHTQTHAASLSKLPNPRGHAADMQVKYTGSDDSQHRGTAIYFLLIVIVHIILRGQLQSFIINYPNSVYLTHITHECM